MSNQDIVDLMNEAQRLRAENAQIDDLREENKRLHARLETVITERLNVEYAFAMDAKRQVEKENVRLLALVESSNSRPRKFLAWAVEMLGPVAKLRGERLMRFIEEAIELAHADEMQRSMLDAIANRVYSRPAGSITQEIGQAQACLETYAENIGECSALQAEIEWQRVRTVPVEEVRRRHKAKQEIGIALSIPSTVGSPEGGR